MSGNKRVYFACLGAARCGGSPITGAVSTSLSLNREFNSILRTGQRKPVTTYGNIPDVEFSYTQYLNSFIPFSEEEAINGPTGFDLLIGNDMVGNSTSAGLFSGSSSLITGNPPPQGSPPSGGVRCSFACLSSVTYNLPVDGFFTVQRTYKGFSKKSAGSIPSFSESQGSVKRRQCYLSGLPEGLGNQAIQNINITFSIDRNPIEEFATRKPYCLATVFPLQTTATFEVFTQSLDSYTIDALKSACQNPPSNKESISLAVSGAGSLQIPEAYLTNLEYSGGDANTNSNQTLTATFTSYTIPNIDSIKPIVKLPLEDPCD